MVAVPDDAPVTTPELAPTVAMAVELLLQEPPLKGSVSVMAAAGQTDDGPVMAGVDVMRLTVSTEVTLVGQPKILVTV